VDYLQVEAVGRSFGTQLLHESADAGDQRTMIYAWQAADVEEGIALVGQTIDLAGVAAQRSERDCPADEGLAHQWPPSAFGRQARVRPGGACRGRARERADAPSRSAR